jgi:hypothetical protein
MKVPRTLHVTLRPSRIAVLAFGGAASATVLLLAWLPLPSEWRAASLGVVAAYAASTLARLSHRDASRAVVALEIGDDLRGAMIEVSGRRIEGTVLGATYVGARLASIVLRPDGARWSRSVAVFPDMLAEEDFRRLRVMLRLARSPRS